MVDAKALRQALAEFLGLERFQKFIRHGCAIDGLKFWQEQEWRKFIKVHPEFSIGLQELAVVLRICELHGDELLPDTVEVFHGCVDHSREYEQLCSTLFVNANDGPWSTEGGELVGDRHDVWFCPTCRQVKAEWKRRPRNVT